VEVGRKRHDTTALSRGKKPRTHWLGRLVGFRGCLDGVGKSRPTGIQTPDRPARKESLQILSYLDLEDLLEFMRAFRSILFKLRNVSDTSCREKQNTHFLFNNLLPCHLWDNVKMYGTDGQVTNDHIIQSMLFACCVNKAAEAQSEYITFNASPWQH
jgi:hypothetical protein